MVTCWWASRGTTKQEEGTGRLKQKPTVGTRREKMSGGNKWWGETWRGRRREGLVDSCWSVYFRGYHSSPDVQQHIEENENRGRDKWWRRKKRMWATGGVEVVARSGCQSATWSAAGVTGRNVLSQDEMGNTSIPDQRPRGENINREV